MSRLHWRQYGQGMNVVLLHGWGMNGVVWDNVVQVLSTSFCVHVVDLPGYGDNVQCTAESLSDIVQLLIDQAPPQATWLGWSLGGLFATQVALTYPERVQKLVTVASSPYFSSQPSSVDSLVWRGMAPKVLRHFASELNENFTLTIERFMALQAMGSPSARRDVKQIKQAVLSRATPNKATLQLGLDLLTNVDLRTQLNQLTMPRLRLYGRLDGLVPVQVAKDVSYYDDQDTQHIFQHSSHAPFMTELESFCHVVQDFIVQTD